MQKTKLTLRFSTQAMPVATHRLQQTKGAHNVGFNEFAGAMNGAVYMAFSGKVEHSTGLVFGQQFGQQRSITNVTLHKHMLRIVFQGSQGLQITGVGELVEIDDFFIAVRHPVQDKIGTNEACAAGNENGHVFSFQNCILEALAGIATAVKVRLYRSTLRSSEFPWPLAPPKSLLKAHPILANPCTAPPLKTFG